MSMETLKVKKLHPDAKVPQRAHPTDAGLDLFSLESAILPRAGRVPIRTGISLAVPVGYGLFIWPRSGLAVKHGLDKMAGVIDSGYRGEIVVVLINLGDEDVILEKGAKIAQAILAPVSLAIPEEVDHLDDTSRGNNGFGSSG